MLAGEVMEEAKKEWPTPTAHGNTNRKGATKKSGDGLRTAAVNGHHDQANRNTTGRSRGSSLTGELISRFRYSMRIQEVGEVLMEWRVKLVARLNPRWVCQLMGFPADWLDDVEWPPLKR